MAKREPSWWRLRQIRHRDAVILAILSAACLLGGQVTDNATQCASPPCSISGIYEDNVAPYLTNPPVLVLFGGLHCSSRRGGWGRFPLGLGLGVSLLGLVGRLSRTILTTGKPFGDPLIALLAVTASLSGLGILLGIVSHTLMGKYALMLKKHAKRVLRRWRKSRRPTDRSSKSRVT